MPFERELGWDIDRTTTLMKDLGLA
jgi:hypothetical protein